MVVPFQRVATQPSAATAVQSAPEVARAVLALDDAQGEALRVYARLWDGQVQYALAQHDGSGLLRLADWRSYDGEPLLSWTVP